MVTLEQLLSESQEGSKEDQDRFACQFNKVSNMLYQYYGIRSVHLTFVVRDILIRISKGESILEEV